MAGGYNRRSNLWLPVLYIVIALSHCRSVLFHLQNGQCRLLANSPFSVLSQCWVGVKRIHKRQKLLRGADFLMCSVDCQCTKTTRCVSIQA